MSSERDRFYPLSILIFLSGYVSYGISKACFVICALPLIFLLAPLPEYRARVLHGLTHRYLGFFTRTWLPLLGLYRVVEITGLAQAQAVRPAVIVANHRGFMDGIFMLGLLPRTGALIKARDTRQPTYGLLDRHFDLVGVDRSSLSSVSASLERCRALIASGKNLLVFPEGTRARSGKLQHFNRIAFQLAVSNCVPVLPVVIHSTCPFMAKVRGSIFPHGRNEFRIRFLDAEMPHPDDDADSLGERVHRRMARELKALDRGTVWETLNG